jgi:hypothetical protein
VEGEFGCRTFTSGGVNPVSFVNLVRGSAANSEKPIPIPHYSINPTQHKDRTS